MRKLLVILLIGLTAWGCSYIAPMLTAPKKRSEFANRSFETSSHQLFWNTLHKGEFENLPQVINRLHEAYQQDPNDFKVAAHLGFAYTWRLSERYRQEPLEPSVAAYGDLAEEYFSRAVQLNPHDPRLRGFEAGLMLANASRHADPKQQAKAYMLGKKAIRMWPSFNLFSMAYVMSVLPHDSKRFGEAVELHWRNLEACLCREIDRENPELDDVGAIPQRVKGDTLKTRACTNSWIAPHNVEGFLLNLGDMLVKAGKVDQAREVYRSARQVAAFKEWPYKVQLQKRIDRAASNVQMFRAPAKTTDPERHIFIESPMACTGCHQMSDKEFKAQLNNQPDLNRKTYFLKNQ